MILFSALLVPLLFAIVLFIFFKHSTAWWEFLIPFGTALIVALIFKVTIETTATSDTEYWSGTIQKAEYYEPWNEYIHQTCTRQVACGTDSKGNTTYCSESYDCSYVQYHSEYWEITDDNGISINVSEFFYKRLLKRFGVPYFVELNRNSYTQDGDKYVSEWLKTDKTIECMVTSRSYRNRVQAARDVFNYPDVDTTEIKLYDLHQYPQIIGYYDQINLLGKIKYWSFYNRQLEVLNAKLGHKKQIKVFVILFRGKERDAGFKQEALWKGGNKNELVICIGLDKDDNVTWAYPFSWTDKQIVKVNIRTHIEAQKKLDLSEIIDYTYNEVDKNFVRKNWKDFDYLTIEPTTNEIMWTFIITFIINLGLSIWIITNEFDENKSNKNKYY